MAKVKTVYMMVEGKMKPFTMKQYLAMRTADARIRSLKFIPMDSRMYEAAPAQFKAWKQERNRYAYVHNNCPEYAEVSYDALSDGVCFGDELIADDTMDVSAEAISNCMEMALHAALDQLTPAEQQLIHALFFDGMTEREYAQSSGLAPMTVHNRKVRILEKLKKIINSKK